MHASAAAYHEPMKLFVKIMGIIGPNAAFGMPHASENIGFRIIVIALSSLNCARCWSKRCPLMPLIYSLGMHAELALI